MGKKWNLFSKKRDNELPECHVPGKVANNEKREELLSRSDQRRHTAAPGRGKQRKNENFKRGEDTRLSLGNYELAMSTHCKTYDDNRRLNREKEFWKHRATSEHGEIPSNITVDFSMLSKPTHNRNSIETQTERELGATASLPSTSIGNEEILRSLLQKIDKLTMEKKEEEERNKYQIQVLRQESSVEQEQKEVYRKLLIQEKQCHRESKSSRKELENSFKKKFLRLIKGVETNTKRFRKIERTILEQGEKLDDIATVVRSSKDFICELLLMLPSHTNVRYDVLPQALKDVMNHVETLVGPKWQDLVHALGLPEGLVPALADRANGERYWIIMCEWYRQQGGKENNQLISAFTQACTEIQVNVWSDVPIPKEHQLAIGKCKRLLTEDGDATIIVPYMEQHLQFPRCLDGYFDTPTRHQGMIRLIDVLPVFGDKGIHVLMRAMDECGFAHLATVLCNELEDATRNNRSQVCMEEQLPMRFDSMRKPRPEVDVHHDYPVNTVGKTNRDEEIYQTVKHTDAVVMHMGMQMSKLEYELSQQREYHV